MDVQAMASAIVVPLGCTFFAGALQYAACRFRTDSYSSSASTFLLSSPTRRALSTVSLFRPRRMSPSLFWPAVVTVWPCPFRSQSHLVLVPRVSSAWSLLTVRPHIIALPPQFWSRCGFLGRLSIGRAFLLCRVWLRSRIIRALLCFSI